MIIDHLRYKADIAARSLLPAYRAPSVSVSNLLPKTTGRLKKLPHEARERYDLYLMSPERE